MHKFDGSKLITNTKDKDLIYSCTDMQRLVDRVGHVNCKPQIFL